MLASKRDDAALRVFLDRAEVGARLAAANATDIRDDAVTADASLPRARAHGRCAVVGSGHALACSAWGSHIDGYDAVFRVNAAQGSGDVRRKHACRTGR